MKKLNKSQLRSALITMAILLILAVTGLCQSSPVTFTPAISGPAIYGEPDSINPGYPFYFDLYTNYAETHLFRRVTWSSPFVFTGNNISHISWGNTTQFVPYSFLSHCEDFWEIYTESWDGALPDLLCVACISHMGLPDMTNFLYMHAQATITLTGSEGTICIDSGDAVDNAWDWLFDDPQPSFGGPYCWTVKACGGVPGDPNSSGTFNALDITYLINYLHKHGPAPKPDSLISGDADCDCATNILDVTYLINFLYKHQPPPCSCGEWRAGCP